MKGIILCSAESLKSLSPHVINAVEICNHLGWDLAFNTEDSVTEFLSNNTYSHIGFTYGTGREVTSTAVPLLLDNEERLGEKPKLFYFKNEYDLGENHILWTLAKQYGYTYQMVTNNVFESETRCKKFWTDWHVLQLNSLIYQGFDFDWMAMAPPPSMFPIENAWGCKEFGLLYYGSYREGREKYFKEYVDSKMFFSTSTKNRPWFQQHFKTNFVPPISKGGLIRFKYSIYIEDEQSNKFYTHLANRFYECLDYDVLMFFDESCRGTVEKSGYPIGNQFFVKNKAELHTKIGACENDFDLYMSLLGSQRVHRKQATFEKLEALGKIKDIVNAWHLNKNNPI